MSTSSRGSRNSRVISQGGFRFFLGPSGSAPSSVKPWIGQFLEIKENSWYVAVDENWVADWFNQYGVSNQFDDFEAAVELIANRQSEQWTSFGESKVKQIHGEALHIYGMMHARWICQPRGMAQMKEKYESGKFGQCPRFSCGGAKVVPMGQTFAIRRRSMKVFCPKCCDIYRPQGNILIDGAHFGPAFPHMFLCEYEQFDKSADFRAFEVKAFGFKVRRPPKTVLAHETNRHQRDVPAEPKV